MNFLAYARVINHRVKNENGAFVDLVPGKRLTRTGQITFNEASTQSQYLAGTLYNTMRHELGHVLGITTLSKQFPIGFQTAYARDEKYTGPIGVQEYRNLKGNPYGEIINDFPLDENSVHFSASEFAQGQTGELMTPFILTNLKASRLSFAVLEDLGYNPDYTKAESYSLPSVPDQLTYFTPDGPFNTAYPNTPEDLNTELINRIGEPSAFKKQIYASYGESSVVTRQNNWAKDLDFSGVAWDDPQAGTLIHPRVALVATHFKSNRGVGSSITFHDSQGVPQTRIIEKVKSLTSTDTDITILL
jgi:hypothetical protein